MNDAELLALADAAAARAYAPYSNFHVGCAVLARDGRVIEGVNVENAAYPLGVCAERTAFSRAVAEGHRPGDFEVAAITASPCGGCRQWLLEMGVDRVVFRNGGRVLTMTPAELLPESFDSSDLDVKSGFVAVAGRPNVGKSTLVNALCGEKIAITSTVPNTTRRRLFGVAHGDDYQLALVDLPGFQRPMDALTERMQQTVDASFDDVDAVLLVVDARARIGAGDRFVARRVFGIDKPVIIALNKVDRLKPAHIAMQMKAAATLGDFHALHPVSAKTKEGVGELRSDLVYLLPEGPAYFPDGQKTDLAVEERVAEVIREKALHLTREEVPHALTVEVDEVEERRLLAVIYVETESQKGILVGKKGATVREIGTRARPEVEALLGHPVFLELKVKVRPKWRRDPRMLERLGL